MDSDVVMGNSTQPQSQNKKLENGHNGISNLDSQPEERPTSVNGGTNPKIAKRTASRSSNSNGKQDLFVESGSVGNGKTELGDPISETLSIGAQGESEVERNGTETKSVSGGGGRRSTNMPPIHQIRRTEIVKYFKRTTISEQFLKDGEVIFTLLPTVDDVETTSPEQKVDLEECTEETFVAAQKQSTQRDVHEVKDDDDVDMLVDAADTVPVIQEPSDYDGSSVGGSEKRFRKAKKVELISEDEGEPDRNGNDCTVRPKRGAAGRTVTEHPFHSGAYVLAKYSDNCYYPAQILPTKAMQANHFCIRFLDSKEEESTHESQILKPCEWLTVDRTILVKAGKGQTGGEYEDAKLLKVLKTESKAPRYLVQLLGEDEKTVGFAELGISDDEILREKFEKTPPAHGNKNQGGTEETKNATNGDSRTKITKPAEAKPAASKTTKRDSVQPSTSKVVEDSGFTTGAMVLALWIDQRFYPAKIESSDGEDFKVKFLDGAEHSITAKDIILAQDIIQPGNVVQVQLANLNFGKAVIKEVNGTSDATQVTVEFDDKHCEERHISEVCFVNRDVRKVMSALASAAKPTPPRKEKQTSEKPSRSKEEQPSRHSVRLSAESPKKVTEEKKEMPKTKSSAKSKAKPQVVEIQDSPDEAEEEGLDESFDDQPIRVGSTTFLKGDKIFGKWEDSRWYAAVVTGGKAQKFKVLWCENEQESFLSPEDMIRAVDILHRGLRVNVIVPNKDFYDEVAFEEYVDDGQHIVKGRKGQQFQKKFEEMMIQANEVKKYKAKLDTEARKPETVEKKPSGSTHATPSSSKKRPRSPSVEPDSTQGPSKPTPPSKRNQKSSQLDDSPGPEPAPSEPPFANCAFIITSGAEKDLTFERDYVVGKVSEMGGAILNTFDDLLTSPGKRFLIAPTACRTAKYLQCLAANIPCVSHKWILEAATASKYIPYDSFRLPAGRSSSMNKTIPWQPRKMLLDNLRVGLYGGNVFRSTWVPALKAGNATPTLIDDDASHSNMKRFDCVIVEDSAPATLVESCNEDNVPVVTVEWIIQTLIHGTRQQYEFWPYQDAAGTGSGVDDTVNNTPRK